MKLPSEVIPKFIISLEKNKERQEYLKKELYPKITNYFKCAAFDGELDDANEILKDNKIFLSDIFYDKCNEGQLGCYLSHFQLWKHIIKSNIDLAIILEDDVKIYNNFNKIIDTIYENLPVKFDYVHLFIHPDKQNIQYLDGKDGDIIPAEDNFGTVAYIISLRGAKKLVKLTELLKIQAPVDRQINFCIRHNFIKAFMVKKPFLLTQGEILPNRGIYENSFKSTIWYSKKLKDTKRIREEFIKLAGFTEEDVEKIDLELMLTKNKNEDVKIENDDPVIIKKIEVDLPEELEKEKEKNIEQESEEEQILNSVITRLNEM
jgi:GR25 family glycosyltransferase involved in LPS biosynthesis